MLWGFNFWKTYSMIFLSFISPLIPPEIAYDIFSGKITPENIDEYWDAIDEHWTDIIAKEQFWI